MQGKYVYIKYDKLGLPMYVADSVAELARVLNFDRRAFYRSLTHTNGIYKKVWIDEEGDEDEL